MIKYNVNFRNDDKNLKKKLFEEMQDRVNDLNSVSSDDIIEKENNLPNASIQINNTLHILLYPIESRNMIILSRVNKIINFMLKGFKIYLHIEITKITANSVKRTISMLISLGVEIFFSKSKEEDYLIDLENDLNFFYDKNERNKAFSVENNKIIINKNNGNHKNWKYSLLVIFYGISKGKNWKIEWLNDENDYPKHFNELISSIINANHINGVKTNVILENIEINYDPKKHLSESFFDNEVRAHNQKTGKTSYTRESNLYIMHNDLLHKIANKFKQDGYIFTTEKMNIDIICEKDGKYIIGEVKNKPTRQNIFKGVGQLLYYRKIFSEKFKINRKDIILVFASFEPLDEKYVSFMDEQTIKYVNSLNA